MIFFVLSNVSIGRVMCNCVVYVIFIVNVRAQTSLIIWYLSNKIKLTMEFICKLMGKENELFMSVARKLKIFCFLRFLPTSKSFCCQNRLTNKHKAIECVWVNK